MNQSKHKLLMIYGFIDESGVPGNTNPQNDYIGVSILLFPNLKTVEGAILKLTDLRKTLQVGNEFEFHFSENTKKVQTQVIELLSELDFQYIFVYLDKTNHTTFASYKNLVNHLLAELVKHNINQPLIIRMDDNPALYHEFRQQSKNFDIKLRIKQVHSKNAPLVQAADYVVSGSTRKLKGKKMPPNWRKIEKKRL